MGDFKATVKITSESRFLNLADVRSLPRARPCVRLPAGEILLPSYFDEKHGIFSGIWSAAHLDEAEALVWSLWMTATWATFKSAPELLPYVGQIKPRKEHRFGRVLRPGMAS